MLRRIAFTAVSVVALAGGANAQNYAAVNWSGLYVGANAGYGSDASSIGSKLSPFDISPSGGFGGGQIGYNVQNGNIVFGIETDIQGSGISDSKTKSADVYGDGSVIVSAGVKSSLDYFGTVRARLGLATGNTLVYATGGLAYGQISDEFKLSAAVNYPGFSYSASAKATKTVDATGWVIGGGAEHKLTPNLGVKAEYQYINLGQDSGWAKITGEDYAIHTFRVGVNYYFGNSYAPLK